MTVGSTHYQRMGTKPHSANEWQTNKGAQLCNAVDLFTLPELVCDVSTSRVVTF